MPSSPLFLFFLGFQMILDSPRNGFCSPEPVMWTLSPFSCDKYLPWSPLATSQLWGSCGHPDICFRVLLPISGGKLGILICKGHFSLETVPLWLSYTILPVSENVICMIEVKKWVELFAISSLWIICFFPVVWQNYSFCRADTLCGEGRSESQVMAD